MSFIDEVELRALGRWGDVMQSVNSTRLGLAVSVRSVSLDCVSVD